MKSHTLFGYFLALCAVCSAPAAEAAPAFTQMGTLYLNTENPVGLPIAELTTEWGVYDVGATGTVAPYYYPLQGSPYAVLPNGTRLWAFPLVTSPGLAAGWQYSPDLTTYGVPASATAVLLTIKVKAKAQNVAPFNRTNLGQIQLSLASPTNTQGTNEVIHARAEKASSVSDIEGKSTAAEDINTVTIPVGVSMVNGKLVFNLFTSVVGTQNATINRVIYITGYWD
jgi:hypothetical protein